MSETCDDVTIIVPTMCNAARAATLRRALTSIQLQEAGAARILIVANGPWIDEELLRKLAQMRNATIIRLAEGNNARALVAGRSAVRTPYFGFLDDDDEYLPNAVGVRLKALEQDPQAAIAVTDGYERRDGIDELRRVVSPEAVDDPLRGLLKANWLASCGALFRSTLITPDFFDGATRYLEWTLLAYKIASRHRSVLIELPTYRLYESPVSLSKSEAYRLAIPEVLKKITTLDLPEDVHRALLDRVGRAYHNVSSYFLQQGRIGDAWAAHWRSLAWPGGLRYLGYTLRLLSPRRGHRRATPRDLPPH